MIDRLQLFYPVLCADAYPLKSGQPFAPVVPAPWLVLVCLTCGVSLQAATGPAVEGVMHGEDVGPDLLGLPLGGLRQAFPEGFLHFADALFHSPVVLWVVGRAIERDDPVVGEDPVDGSVVERAPVVAFQEERCAVLAEEILQMRGDGLALGLDGHERREAVFGTEVLDRVDVELLALQILAPFCAVDGPGEVGFLPGHVLADLPAGDVALVAFLCGHFRHAAPGEDRLVPYL